MIHRSVTALLQRFNRSDTGLSQTFFPYGYITSIKSFLKFNALEIISLAYLYAVVVHMCTCYIRTCVHTYVAILYVHMHFLNCADC